MEEAIVIPSPNWFHVTIMGASIDGWLIYGGPSKSLCFLEPIDRLGALDSKQRFKVHIFQRAHQEKISSVDISPEWPEKRNVITGGYDGVVKEWNIEPNEMSWSINYIHCQEEHSVQKEQVIGACYGTASIAVSVGCKGHICKWDLNTNVVKRYSTHLKNFKPTCVSCSPHKPLHVAIGTRQGVVFVIDISGIAGKLIYRIRGQDDEINRVNWCPQYSVTLDMVLGKDKKSKERSASSRMDRIRNDLEPSEALEIAIAEKNSREEKKNTSTKQEEEEVIIPEDDMFDVYKDHEASEFGHTKFKPQDVYVKVKEEAKDDFLTECEKLKADILKKKNEPEESIESLVEALDKAHVEERPSGSTEQLTQETESLQESQESAKDSSRLVEYKHLLASIGKYGGVRIWSQTGKLLATCSVLHNVRKDLKDKTRGANWPSLHWYKPESLLVTDGKNQVLEINPLKISGKDKAEWRIVHSLHRRGLYYVSSNAPRVQTPELLGQPDSDWVVWSIGQDRNVISYDMKERKKIEVYTSCGAFLYTVKSCAYDAGKIAITAGDGSIRVWETHTTNELEDQLSTGMITSYWQNVQGKILNAVWHPIKENLLAFGTAESRIGLLDASGLCERPAKTFPNMFKQGVYSLSWGEGMNLYACGNGVLVMFRANKIEEKGRTIKVEVEGQAWEISEVLWTQHGLMVGANNGGVAMLHHKDYHVITATFVYQKMLYTIAWHPQQTTNSEEESKYKNYIALCAIDKSNTIAILEFEDKGEDAKQFNKIVEPLSGHENTVLTVVWNPHRDAQLLSTSQDGTVRIWNVVARECISVFGGHGMCVQSGMWCPQPRLAHKVISAGGDGCLRLWDIRDYPANIFKGCKKEPKKKKLTYRAKEEKCRQRNNESVKPEGQMPVMLPPSEITESDTHEPSGNENVATTVETKRKGSKTFLLPLSAKQTDKNSMTTVLTNLTKYFEQDDVDVSSVLKTAASNDTSLAFLKMFGTTSDLDTLLDYEADHHLSRKDQDSYLMLMFYRGRVDKMIQYASEHDLLDPYLLSLSPSVSFKYWKDTTQLYLAQLDRLVAKGNEDRQYAYRYYGGLIYRKSTALLAMHNLKGCIEVLMEAALFKEAYIVCRLRHIESLAEEVLHKWAQVSSEGGSLMMATILHLVRGDVSEAAITLGRSTEIHHLKLAARLAKLAGHNTFASHMEEIVKTKESQLPETEELKPLPSRAETLLNARDSSESENSDEEDIENAETVINGDGVQDNEPSSSLNGLATAASDNVAFVDASSNVETLKVNGA